MALADDLVPAGTVLVTPGLDDTELRKCSNLNNLSNIANIIKRLPSTYNNGGCDLLLPKKAIDANLPLRTLCASSRAKRESFCRLTVVTKKVHISRSPRTQPALIKYELEETNAAFV